MKSTGLRAGGPVYAVCLLEIILVKVYVQGLKIVPFSHPGKVDFPATQVTFSFSLA